MTVSVMKEGDEFDYAGAHIRMLAPGRDQVTGSMRANDDCLVFTASFGGTTALLEGDAEKPAERRVVGEHPEASRLKVAHQPAVEEHIGRTARDDPSSLCCHLRRGKNVYGHPRREVLERLQRAGIVYISHRRGRCNQFLSGRESVSPSVAIIQ